MDVLDKIVSLVLQDPFLTATEIAHRLGYAEEKSVYYWIDKAHYSGLVAFKRAVLNGQFRVPTRANERSALYGTVPIVEGFTREGSPIVTKRQFPGIVRRDVQYAWQYPQQNDTMILFGDWLLLATLDPVRFRDVALSSTTGWCIAFDHNGTPLIRVLLAETTGEFRRLLVPQMYVPDTESVPRYAIRHLVRNLP